MYERDEKILTTYCAPDGITPGVKAAYDDARMRWERLQSGSPAMPHSLLLTIAMIGRAMDFERPPAPAPLVEEPRRKRPDRPRKYGTDVERRAAISARMKANWAKRKAQAEANNV